MQAFEIYIEVEDSWVLLGVYHAESVEDAMQSARSDIDAIRKYYPDNYAPFINLDYVELGG